ncbi:methylated-DNA--[protein]-cysteine S-methyltransferase [Actinokineospora bangkokensis]|uniref:Methylated-DNA--protein-cysteine methyltransferase n=1 Tax=Actinokineospora bangkokensis TaxID=1193682 RepID=A0A1Q9LTR5_9PSEU|nr:methylated-DNA--[protein]-cysteine S-methyltransferase [Actinokineospora bangkokensis]OLR95426.1 cysteine methyltransferase [Actinokineospora bangkokensis]
MRTHTFMDSPVGTILLVATDGTLSGLYMTEHRHQPPLSTFGERTPHGFDAATAQLTEYFDGERTEFDLPVHLDGTDFQREVWQGLTTIPYGVTISYGELARRIGRTPAASRAVGLANGRNPVSIVVPCHRVIGAGGALTGYGGGLERKEHLLALERARVGAAGQLPFPV